MRTRLQAAHVLGFDGKDHVLLNDAEVVYENDTILFVGKHFEGDCDRTVRCGNSLLSPGFIDGDALGDIAQGMLDWEVPAGKNHCLMWSRDYFARRGELFTPEEEAFKSLYAYAQLIEHGVTTAMPITCIYYRKWAQTYEDLAAAARNAQALGLRAYLGPAYLFGIHTVDDNGTIGLSRDEEQGRAALREAVRFVKDFDGKGGGLIRGALVPERIEYQTEESLLATRRAADELGCLIRLHAAQSEVEYRHIRALHGKTPIQYLHDIGFLAPDVSIPHALFTQGYSRLPDNPGGDDLALLADAGVSVIHCPLVYSRWGLALESFGGYLRRGVNMALGTDTFPPDPILAMRMGNAMAHRMDSNPEGNRCADFYRAATLGGARLLGRDDLGRLAAGAKADLIQIDLSGFDVGPVADPIRTVINSATARDIRTVIINGRTVKENGRVLGVDPEALRDRAQALFDRLRKGYLDRSVCVEATEEALFPSSFPRA